MSNPPVGGRIAPGPRQVLFSTDDAARVLAEEASRRLGNEGARDYFVNWGAVVGPIVVTVAPPGTFVPEETPSL